MGAAHSPGPTVLGLLGGTGPHGRGLATRFAAAGHRVLVGSRDRSRAEEVVEGLRPALPRARLAAGDNTEVAERADLVFVTVPHDAQHLLLPPVRAALAGKVVVSCANPMRVDERGPLPVRVRDGSAAEECQRLLPAARVVSAFQNVSAVVLRHLDRTLECDVLLCGDDPSATTVVADLVRTVPGLSPLEAGPLRLSGPIEDFTAVLVSVNRRYRVHAGVRLTGLPGSTRAADPAEVSDPTAAAAAAGA